MTNTTLPIHSSGASMTDDHRSEQPEDANSKVIIEIANDPEELIDIINENETNNYKLGMLFLALAIATWIIGLEMVNSVLKGDEYNQAFFLAYMIGSSFSFFLVPDLSAWFVREVLGREDNNIVHNDEMSRLNPHGGSQENSKEEILQKNFKEEGPIFLSHKEMVSLAAMISVTYYVYNCAVMVSLQYTFASTQIVIGTLTSIFTLFIGAYMKIDRFTSKKISCSIVSIVGVFLINFHGESSSPDNTNKDIPRNPTLGNLFALLGAFCYALYLIILEVKYESGKKTTDERKLFGYVGLFTLIGGIPLLFLVHILGIETFQLPPVRNKILIMVSLNSLFSACSDYLTILASLLTSPLITSLSLTGAIPIVVLIDYVRVILSGSETSSFGTLYFIGISSILFSVVLININLTSENELIEEVIENALDEAIEDDENLSPIFTPLLRPNSNCASPFMSPTSNHSVGVSKSTLFSAFSPRFGINRNVIAGTNNVPSLNLNENKASEITNFANSNHNQLYSVDSSMLQNHEPEHSNVVVFSRRNHKYRLIPFESNSSEISNPNHVEE